jgi:hypothetical protein
MKKKVLEEVKVLSKKLGINLEERGLLTIKNYFTDKVDWENISEYQVLSEQFIRTFYDKVDWYNISEYQKLSEEFIREFLV